MASPNVSEASVVSRAARADHKCPVIMEFENGSLQEFVGQEPNNSVYLAPIGWDITRKTVLTTKSFARGEIGLAVAH